MFNFRLFHYLSFVRNVMSESSSLKKKSWGMVRASVNFGSSLLHDRKQGPTMWSGIWLELGSLYGNKIADSIRKVDDVLSNVGLKFSPEYFSFLKWISNMINQHVCVALHILFYLTSQRQLKLLRKRYPDISTTNLHSVFELTAQWTLNVEYNIICQSYITIRIKQDNIELFHEYSYLKTCD